MQTVLAAKPTAVTSSRISSSVSAAREESANSRRWYVEHAHLARWVRQRQEQIGFDPRVDRRMIHRVVVVRILVRIDQFGFEDSRQHAIRIV